MKQVTVVGNQALSFLETPWDSVEQEFQVYINQNQRIGGIYSPTLISHWLMNDLGENLWIEFTSQFLLSALSEGRTALATRESP